jgi:hypothetical protein
MNGFAQRWMSTAVAALALLSSGCSQESAAQDEARRKQATEQNAIAAYSAKVSEVDATQREFVKVWERVNGLRDVKAHKEAWDTTLIPAFVKYLESLKSMPVGTKELKRIHRIVLSSHEQTLKDFNAYSLGLADTNLTERSRKILGSLRTLTQADDKYNEELARYYTENKVRLKRNK